MGLECQTGLQSSGTGIEKTAEGQPSSNESCFVGITRGLTAIGFPVVVGFSRKPIHNRLFTVDTESTSEPSVRACPQT